MNKAHNTHSDNLLNNIANFSITGGKKILQRNGCFLLFYEPEITDEMMNSISAKKVDD